MQAKNKEFLIRVKSTVLINIDNLAFSATDFSEAMHLSRSQLHRKLKQITGMSTTDFIRNERLIRATHLLEHSEEAIQTIAYQVGFNNISYFSKCFRAKQGCTPSEFRKRKCT